MDRCPWASSEPELSYHDAEWGIPVYDPRVLFEFLVLEAAQAGLSWRTVLIKRENYRRHYADWDIDRVCAYGAADVERMLADRGLIRNRAKILASIELAQIIQRFGPGAFAEFLWSFVGGAPRVNQLSIQSEIPAQTPEAEAMSRALKKLGARFVGPTICYAFMQAVGMVDDHLTTCPRHTSNRK